MPRKKETPPESSKDAQRLLAALMATLRYIAEHEPSLDELTGAMGISKATAVRHIRAARQVFGMDIISRRINGAASYTVMDYGLFVRERLLSKPAKA